MDGISQNTQALAMVAELGRRPTSFESAWQAIKAARECDTRTAMQLAIDCFPELHQAFLGKQPRAKA